MGLGQKLGSFFLLGSGQVSHPCVWKIFPKKSKYFCFLPLGQKNIIWFGIKNTPVKAVSVPYCHES